MVATIETNLEQEHENISRIYSIVLECEKEKNICFIFPYCKNEINY